jgi:very-short-patch-repair endonuclease
MNEQKISREMKDGLIQLARQMKAEPTQAEALLWKNLRKRQLGGLKFRRQHIIHACIVDFYCPAAKLVIEVDGPVHNEQEEYDQERDNFLQEMGYQVVRFMNADILKNLDVVIAGIYDLCKRRIDSIRD